MPLCRPIFLPARRNCRSFYWRGRSWTRWYAYRMSWPAARLYECQRRRIKVPDDLAVVGFGDSDVSRVCQPPLTTMAVPHRKIGSEAGRALLERLNQGNWSDQNPSPPVYVCGKAAKPLIPSLPVSPADPVSPAARLRFWRCGSSTAPALSASPA